MKSLRRSDAIQNLEAKVLGETLTKGCRKGLPCRDTETDAGEIEIVDLVMEIHQSRVIGRHGKEEGGTITLDYIIDILRRGRSRPKNGRSPNGQRKIETIPQAISKKKLCSAEETIGFPNIQNIAGVLFGRYDHVVLQVNTAFRKAGAPRGIQPESDVVFAGWS